MKIVFFEVEDWEGEKIQMAFPQAQLVNSPLTEENLSQYQDVEILSCFIYSQLKRNILEKLPNLKLIATRSTGFDHIDIDYAKEKNILVANVPEYGSRTVAEYTFSLILTLVKKIYQSINQAKVFDFDHSRIRGFDLAGKTLGIIGLGKIGLEVLKIAKGFAMNVLVYTRTKKEELTHQYQFQYTDLNTLLSSSDIITLHTPLTKETYHLINQNNIYLIKKGAYLINTARGGLVETQALVKALEVGILAGVALDVLEEEKILGEETEILTTSYRQEVDFKTLALNHILVNHPKVIITPHNAFNTYEALERILETTINNINQYLKNTPINLVY
jgi:D-lactate dehydrogenase